MEELLIASNKEYKHSRDLPYHYEIRYLIKIDKYTVYELNKYKEDHLMFFCKVEKHENCLIMHWHDFNGEERTSKLTPDKWELSVCDCGKPICSKYSPCCSLYCWMGKFE